MEKTIYKKLMEVQGSLKANKSRFNKFGGFSYRSAEDILEAVKPLLKQNGLVLVCSDTIENGILTATYSLIDIDSGETLQNSSVAIIGEHKGMSAEQVTGCASSYARKYALNGMFAIDDSSADPDSLDNSASNDNQKSKNALLEAKRKLLALITEAGIKNTNDVKELVGFMGIDTNSLNSINDFLCLKGEGDLVETIKSAYTRMHEQALN